MVKRREYPKRGSRYAKNERASFTREERDLITADKRTSGYYAKNPSQQHYRRRDDSGELSYEQEVKQRAVQIVQEAIQAAEGGEADYQSQVAPGPRGTLGTRMRGNVIPPRGRMEGPSATSAWVKERQMNAPKAPASRPISPPKKKSSKKKQPRMTRQQQDKWLKESKRGKTSYGDKR